MPTTRTMLLGAAACCALLAAPAPARGQQPGAGEQAVAAARKAYYNLPDAGFRGARCDVNVDWDAFVAALTPDAQARAAAAALLRQVRFDAVIGADGAAKVSHHLEGSPPAGMRQALEGIEQALTGVFQELSAFLFGPPLPPENSNYRVEAQDGRFRVVFGSESMKAFETLSPEGRIGEIMVVTDKSTTTMRPQFGPIEKGLLPIVVDSSVAAAGLDKAEVHAEIDYGDTGGFQLPQAMFIRTTQPGANLEARFRFVNYQLTK